MEKLCIYTRNTLRIHAVTGGHNCGGHFALAGPSADLPAWICLDALAITARRSICILFRGHSLLHHPTFPLLRPAPRCSLLLLFPPGDAMGVDFFSGRGVGFGFGIGCGFGIGWGFGGAPLNTLGIGAGGGCGIGLGLGWGFGAAYGTKYLDSKLRFEGIDFDKVKGEHLDQKRLEESSTKQLN